MLAAQVTNKNKAMLIPFSDEQGASSRKDNRLELVRLKREDLYKHYEMHIKDKNDDDSSPLDSSYHDENNCTHSILDSASLSTDEERLMTSGEGGVLPRGLPVGVYSKKLNQDKNKLTVIPSKNWDKLSILKVILYNYDKNL